MFSVGTTTIITTIIGNYRVLLHRGIEESFMLFIRPQLGARDHELLQKPKQII